MSNKGSAILDFGPFPGSNDAVAIVSGETAIMAESESDAWVVSVANSDHTAEDHRFLASICDVSTGSVVAGSGFTIYGFSQEALEGEVSVQWAWA